MAGFVTYSLLPTSSLSIFGLHTQSARKQQGSFSISRRSHLRMCAPEADPGQEAPIQGPSQAPTKVGISTTGLSESESKFIEACYHPDVERIEKMLDDGMNPSIADINGRTALHFCAGNGLPTVCRKLLDLGADINKQDVVGLTPLHMATGYKKIDTVRLLVECDADANIACFKGQLPVELAESMLEKTPKKRFFVENGDYTKIQEIVDVLDEATEEEDEEEADLEEEAGEITEETESAKFVVRVKPKGSTPQPQSAVKVDDVKVTIRVKEPEARKQ